MRYYAFIFMITFDSVNVEVAGHGYVCRQYMNEHRTYVAYGGMAYSG